MKIGIDARMYGPEQGGIGRYVEQLIQHLQKIDSQNQYIIFLRKINFTACEIDNPNFKKVLADIPWYSLKEQLCFTKIIKKEKIDLMHFPHWNVPLFYRGKFILTIHDLIMYHFPRLEASTHGPIKYWLKDHLHRLVLSSAAHRAKAIIATSQFTKQDIVEELEIKPEKITVTYQAPFPHKKILTDISQNLQKPYALYVGASYPHKNIIGLLCAWKKIEERNDQVNLVLAGRKNYFTQSILNSSELQNCKHVQHIPDPTDNDLETLYQNAELFVFPSLYEGFGLPPLEAMLRNVPVVSSNASCLTEVLGNAAWYFDPYDTDDMARKILIAFENDELRTTLKKSAQELLPNYSWDKLTKETLQTYKKVDNF